MQSTEPTSLDRLEALVKQNSEDIKQFQRWNSLQWDAIKFVGTIAVSLTIASTVALIGILLRLGGA